MHTTRLQALLEVKQQIPKHLFRLIYLLIAWSVSLT